MLIEIVPNPNSAETGFFAFEELGLVKTIKAVRFDGTSGGEIWDVTGVDGEGIWCQAKAQKVSDSGAAFGYLIYGGSWGIRLKRRNDSSDWNLKDPDQKGEAYLVYSDEEGLIYG